MTTDASVVYRDALACWAGRRVLEGRWGKLWKMLPRVDDEVSLGVALAAASSALRRRLRRYNRPCLANKNNVESSPQHRKPNIMTEPRPAPSQISLPAAAPTPATSSIPSTPAKPNAQAAQNSREHAMAYYDKLRKQLRDLIQQKRHQDKQLVRLFLLPLRSFVVLIFAP